jgi:pimeloyl-ACP methyl ester carboxylesterase
MDASPGSIDGMEKLALGVIKSTHPNQSGSAETPYEAGEILRSLTIPALFICGADDGVLPEEMDGYPALMKTGNGRFVSLAVSKWESLSTISTNG